LLKENLDIRHANQRCLDDTGLTEVIAKTGHSDQKFVFTRILGHKGDIPGSG
jgi:hypothetical protein